MVSTLRPAPEWFAALRRQYASRAALFRWSQYGARFAIAAVGLAEMLNPAYRKLWFWRGVGFALVGAGAIVELFRFRKRGLRYSQAVEILDCALTRYEVAMHADSSALQRAAEEARVAIRNQPDPAPASASILSSKAG